MDLNSTICNRPETNFVQNLYHSAGKLFTIVYGTCPSVRCRAA